MRYGLVGRIKFNSNAVPSEKANLANGEFFLEGRVSHLFDHMFSAKILVHHEGTTQKVHLSGTQYLNGFAASLHSTDPKWNDLKLLALYEEKERYELQAMILPTKSYKAIPGVPAFLCADLQDCPVVPFQAMGTGTLQLKPYDSLLSRTLKSLSCYKSSKDIACEQPLFLL